MEQMNVRIELLTLQLKAQKLSAAEFAAKFITIAEEYNRLQLLQQTPCTAQLPSDDDLFAIVEKILFQQSSSDPMTECVNKMNLLRQFINDKCLSAIA